MPPPSLSLIAQKHPGIFHNINHIQYLDFLAEKHYPTPDKPEEGSALDFIVFLLIIIGR